MVMALELYASSRRGPFAQLTCPEGVPTTMIHRDTGRRTYAPVRTLVNRRRQLQYCNWLNTEAATARPQDHPTELCAGEESFRQKKRDAVF